VFFGVPIGYIGGAFFKKYSEGKEEERQTAMDDPENGERTIR